MGAAVMEPRKKSLLDRLPVSSHIRQSVGLQRTMLLIGVVLCTFFLLAAVFAPLLAPYGYSQISDDTGSFPAQAEPGGKHLLGTTVGG